MTPKTTRRSLAGHWLAIVTLVMLIATGCETGETRQTTRVDRSDGDEVLRNDNGGADSDDAAERSDSAPVNEQGAAASTGPVSVRLAPGAAPPGSRLNLSTLQAGDAPAGYRNGPAFQATIDAGELSGVATFEVSVPGVADDEVAELWFQGTDGEWLRIPSVWDAASAVLRAETKHFTNFRVTLTRPLTLFTTPSVNPGRLTTIAEMTQRWIGLRAPDLACDGAPPSWAELKPPGVDRVHSCAVNNPDGDGNERAEIRVRNNRGVVLRVDYTDDPEYVWADHTSGIATAVARFGGFIGDRSVYLFPGHDSTAGLAQPASNLSFRAEPRIDAVTWLSSILAIVGGIDPDDFSGIGQFIALGLFFVDCTGIAGLINDPEPSLLESAATLVAALPNCVAEVLGLSPDGGPNAEKAETVAREILKQTGGEATDKSIAQLVDRLSKLATVIRLADAVLELTKLADALADNLRGDRSDPDRMDPLLALTGYEDPIRSRQLADGRWLITFEDEERGPSQLIIGSGDQLTVGAFDSDGDQWFGWSGADPAIFDFRPAGEVRAWYLLNFEPQISANTDATGNLFLGYERAGLEGVTVVRVNPGPNMMGSEPPQLRFWPGHIIDPDGDGVFEIETLDRGCAPACPPGARVLHRWSGSDYVAERPSGAPVTPIEQSRVGDPACVVRHFVFYDPRFDNLTTLAPPGSAGGSGQSHRGLGEDPTIWWADRTDLNEMSIEDVERLDDFGIVVLLCEDDGWFEFTSVDNPSFRDALRAVGTDNAIDHLGLECSAGFFPIFAGAARGNGFRLDDVTAGPVAVAVCQNEGKELEYHGIDRASGATILLPACQEVAEVWRATNDGWTYTVVDERSSVRGVPGIANLTAPDGSWTEWQLWEGVFRSRDRQDAQPDNC